MLIPLTLISCLIYFKPKKIRSNISEGPLLGIVYIVSGLILDAVITVPLFIKDYSFFLDFTLLIGVIEIIVITLIVGAVKK